MPPNMHSEGIGDKGVIRQDPDAHGNGVPIEGKAEGKVATVVAVSGGRRRQGGREKVSRD